MTDRLDNVWTARDFPVLKEVTRRIDAGGSGVVMIRDIANSLEMSSDDVRNAVRALERTGYLRATWGLGGNGYINDITASAYLTTGLHPDGDDLAARLIDAALQAAELTDDPDERTRLRRFADGAANVSRTVLSGVITAVITRGLTGV